MNNLELETVQFAIDLLKKIRGSKFITNKGEKHKEYAVPMKIINKYSNILHGIKFDLIEKKDTKK